MGPRHRRVHKRRERDGTDGRAAGRLSGWETETDTETEPGANENTFFARHRDLSLVDHRLVRRLGVGGNPLDTLRDEVDETVVRHLQ